MHYTGTIIRPPSEADSILLQVTTGCSHNRCTFCGVYKNSVFSIRDDQTIEEDIREAAEVFRGKERVFLCDGDALILPQAKLLSILTCIRSHLTNVSRVSTYANAKSISRKTDDELKELFRHGLKMIHLGLESGDDETLFSIQKWGNSETIIRESRRIIDAGMHLFVTVLLGIAGKERSLTHARLTGLALSRIDPRFVGALTFMPVENTALSDQINSGTFTLLTPREIMVEIRCLLENITLSSGYFYANHASNFLPLRVKLPREKPDALAMIDKAIHGTIALKPDMFRGL